MEPGSTFQHPNSESACSLQLGSQQSTSSWTESIGTQISPPIDTLLSLLVLVLFSEEVSTDFCIPFGFLTPCEF
jgi:hypothetical protein